MKTLLHHTTCALLVAGAVLSPVSAQVGTGPQLPGTPDVESAAFSEVLAGSLDPQTAQVMVDAALPDGWIAQEYGLGYADDDQGSVAWFDVFDAADPQQEVLGQLHLASGPGGAVEVVSVTSSLSGLDGIQTTSRLVSHLAPDTLAESVVVVDLDGQLVSDAFELSEGTLGGVGYAGNSLKECIRRCLRQAGIQIGFFAAVCLIAVVLSVAASGGLGAPLGVPVLVTCLGGSVGTGAALLNLAHCIQTKCLN